MRGHTRVGAKKADPYDTGGAVIDRGHGIPGPVIEGGTVGDGRYSQILGIVIDLEQQGVSFVISAVNGHRHGYGVTGSNAAHRADDESYVVSGNGSYNGSLSGSRCGCRSGSGSCGGGCRGSRSGSFRGSFGHNGLNDIDEAVLCDVGKIDLARGGRGEIEEIDHLEFQFLVFRASRADFKVHVEEYAVLGHTVIRANETNPDNTGSIGVNNRRRIPRPVHEGGTGID